MTHVTKHINVLVFVFLIAFVLGAVSTAHSAEKMTFEEWQGLMTEYKAREDKANREIENLNRQITELKKQIADADRQIAAVKREIQNLLGATESEVEAFISRLESIERRVKSLERLSRDELSKRISEIDGLITSLTDMKKSKISLIPRVGEKIDDLLSRLNALKKAAGVYVDYYTVIRGDCLWRISARSSIYNDPYMWPRIFQANRDQIKNEDLIYPKQVFKIPRGVPSGFHLVVRGEYLSKIAGYSTVYRDASKWTKIYEANRDRIKNPNLIYPAWLLRIPD